MFYGAAQTKRRIMTSASIDLSLPHQLQRWPPVLKSWCQSQSWIPEVPQAPFVSFWHRLTRLPLWRIRTKKRFHLCLMISQGINPHRDPPPFLIPQVVSRPPWGARGQFTLESWNAQGGNSISRVLRVVGNRRLEQLLAWDVFNDTLIYAERPNYYFTP